ncbi:hypothetical protein RhiirA1_464203 [Rhizophagus irregularis]|uniref:Uncharacterized protein n=1 Tax=Rhizophagus irregularis TaxID=588596 RepID=A0A2N0RII8_9GLOM|nr:hypothetical protein RhiirA1_464203 [Rhizophagus irregularis]
MGHQKEKFSRSYSKQKTSNLTSPSSFPSIAHDEKWCKLADKLMDSQLAYIKLLLVNRWQSVITYEKNLKDYESSYIPLYLPDNKVLTTYRLVLADSSRYLKLFHLRDQKYLKFVDFWRTSSERSTLKDLLDFHLICSGSSRNSLFSEFMPPTVVPAFMPDDHQDDSSDMTLDPVFQSVIQNPAFQRIWPMGPDPYYTFRQNDKILIKFILTDKYNPYTFGSDGEMDKFLLPDYPIQLIPIDYKNNATQCHSSRPLNYDDDDSDLSIYVPSTSISVAQLMSDTGLSIATATRLVAKLPALHAAAKAIFALPIVTPSRQINSFIDFDKLLSVYDVPFLPCTFDASTLNDDSEPMASSYDFSTLSWEEVLFKLHEVEDLCAKCILKQKTLLAHFNSLSDSFSAKSRVYLAFGPLCQLDNSLFEQKCLLYLRLDFLSFTANSKNDIAILSANDHPSYDDSVNNDPSPLPLTVWTSNHEANPNVILDLCIPSLQLTFDTADSDISALPPVSSLNYIPVAFLPPASASALCYDNIQPTQNVRSNRLYFIQRGNCYFLLDPTSDLNNCYTIHTNSPLLSTNRISFRTQHKYFNRLRQLLLIQRQSYFYLGFYFSCPHCKTLATYVMSCFRHTCHIYDKKLIQTPPLPSSSPFTLPCKCISERQNDGFYKTVTFRRLETFYHKSYAFYDVFKYDNGLLTT